jgi:Tetratricopeptide repeat
MLREQGMYEQAEDMHRQTVKLREKVLGREHPETLTSMNNLALVLSEQGEYEQAKKVRRR